jgi:hypothetical protein
MFRLRRRLRDLILGLAGSWTVACQPTPSEMPPLAPRPEPIQPNAAPIPGAADPIQSSPGPGPALPPQDAGVSIVPPVPGAFIAERAQARDAGTRIVFDAAPDARSTLPPLLDGGVPRLDGGLAR